MLLNVIVPKGIPETSGHNGGEQPINETHFSFLDANKYMDTI
jgi:hypothetical protein